jgi:hypothetical protein
MIDTSMVRTSAHEVKPLKLRGFRQSTIPSALSVISAAKGFSAKVAVDHPAVARHGSRSDLMRTLTKNVESTKSGVSSILGLFRHGFWG